MEEPKQNVFVIWDLSSKDVRVLLQGLVRRPPQGFRVFFADPDKQGGDLLTEILIPQIQRADCVFVIEPPTKDAFLGVAFELGLAIGFRKPIAIGTFQHSGTNLNVLIENVVHSGKPIPDEHVIGGLGSLDRLRTAFEQEGSWRKISYTAQAISAGEVTLCPSLGEGEILQEELTSAEQDLKQPDLSSRLFLQETLAALKLRWIITSARGDYSALMQNLRNSLAAGIFFAQSHLREERDSKHPLRVLRSKQAPAVRSIQKLEKTFGDLDEFVAILHSGDREGTDQTLRIEKLQIRNFKSIEDLSLDFTLPSSLSGDWTCIAGINGAGKSSILQALNMVLLGEKLVTELGSERIKRMLRRVGTDRLDAEITAVLRDGPEQRILYLPLSEQGLDRIKLFSHTEYSRMLELWDRLQKQILVAYGATRNVSDFIDTRYSGLSLHVQRQMTLFDPLTQVANVDVLLGKRDSAPILANLKKLLATVLQGELATSESSDPDRIVFAQGDADVEPIELPDGFRSTIAWLADLCAAWHQSAPPEETVDSDPAKIRGIVLLDEIDLHLHPSLQRALIPRLREALPNVQFIVTTHSPLVLSSFDRAELVVLDRDRKEGIRELDRQIFAFSTDQVYEWLMETPPQSMVMDEKMREGTDPDLALYLYQSKDFNEDQARAELQEMKQLREELLGTKPRQS